MLALLTPLTPASYSFEVVNLPPTHFADAWFSGGALAGSRFFLAPIRSPGIGIFDVQSKQSSLYDISTSVRTQYRFSDAVVAGSECRVYFAPYNAQGVGVYSPDANGFRLISIRSQIDVNEKFLSAAGVGEQVVFAPYAANGVGVIDTRTNAFRLIDITEAYSPHAPQLANGGRNLRYKFGGAVALDDNTVVFAVTHLPPARGRRPSHIHCSPPHPHLDSHTTPTQSASSTHRSTPCRLSTSLP